MSWECLFTDHFYFRMYHLFIDNRGEIEVFESAGWLAGSIDVLMGLTQCTVQLFFASRLHIVACTVYPELRQKLLPAVSAPLRDYIISKHCWVTVFICIAAFGTLCGSIGTGMATLWVKEYSRFAKFKVIAITWGVSTMAADITITVAMTYHLHRAKGTFKRTDQLLECIIQRESCVVFFLSCSSDHVLQSPYRMVL